MTKTIVYDAKLLAARAEIAEALNLFCHALDRHQWELMALVFHDDATVKYSFRPNVQSIDEWLAPARVTMSTLPSTLHQIGNMLIEVDGDVAWTETYVTATHRVPPDAPKTSFWDGRDEPYDGVGAGRYVDRFERRDGRWKIAAREAYIEWRNDAPLREGSLPPIPEEIRSKRGNSDASQPVVEHRLRSLS